MIDPRRESISKAAQRTIESHLADVRAKLVAGNRKPKHIRETITIIKAMTDVRAFVTAEDITADGVNAYAEGLKASGRSARTIQKHLAAMTQFTRWLVRHQKLEADPLLTVQKPNPKGDRRHERRMLLPEEFHYLLRSTTLKDRTIWCSRPRAGIAVQNRNPDRTTIK